MYVVNIKDPNETKVPGRETVLDGQTNKVRGRDRTAIEGCPTTLSTVNNVSFEMQDR